MLKCIPLLIELIQYVYWCFRVHWAISSSDYRSTCDDARGFCVIVSSKGSSAALGSVIVVSHLPVRLWGEMTYEPWVARKCLSCSMCHSTPNTVYGTDKRLLNYGSHHMLQLQLNNGATKMGYFIIGYRTIREPVLVDWEVRNMVSQVRK